MPVVRDVEEEVRFDQLDPLFASVAESTVIFGPMIQVGCASASSAVTGASAGAGEFAQPPEHPGVTLPRDDAVPVLRRGARWPAVFTRTFDEHRQAIAKVRRAKP